MQMMIEWETPAGYDETLKTCEQLKLIEIVWHGEHDYGRITTKGYEVLATLLTMLQNRGNPKNKLKTS